MNLHNVSVIIGLEVRQAHENTENTTCFGNYIRRELGSLSRPEDSTAQAAITGRHSALHSGNDLPLEANQ